MKSNFGANMIVENCYTYNYYLHYNNNEYIGKLFFRDNSYFWNFKLRTLQIL